MFKIKIVLFLLLTFCLIFAIVPAADAQCAMCRATVDSNLSEGRGVIGTGINFGILYLLLTPYLLIGALIFFWFRAGRKGLANNLK